MAYFAQIWTTGTTLPTGVTYQENEVMNVIVVPDSQADRGQEYLVDDLGLSGTTWIQTVYDGTIRKNFGGIGMLYDEEHDMFIEKQPYSSWTLNTDTGKWDPPTPYPDDGNEYYWDEDSLSWVELPPWPSPSVTPSITVSPSVTPSITPSITVSPTPGLSPTPTPSPSVTPT